MVPWSVAISVLLASVIALAVSFEPESFDVVSALAAHGLNVSTGKELRSTETNSRIEACKNACSTLVKRYGSSQVLVRGTQAYRVFTGSYWSMNQEDIDPYCIFVPSTPNEVCALVLLSRSTKCPFAAKSGGHAAFVGASSIQDGITMSFANLNLIKVSTDRKTASIQPGNTWGQVYTELARSDLAVIGGRVYRIGVGGLTLGGGISFFSSLYGWACDNVQSYDVVTARGDIVTATQTSNSDLFWALRGGGNNFGLVVNFELNTIPLPNNMMWGGTRTYTEANFTAVNEAFSQVVADSPEDGNAGLWVAFVKFNGMKLASATLWYAKPKGGKAKIFSGLNAIPAVADTAQTRTLVNFTSYVQESNPYGFREVYWCFTTKANKELLSVAVEIYYEEISALDNVTGIVPALLLQGITLPELRKMAKNGGNPLGLSPAEGPFYLISIPCFWQNSADDTKVYKVISRILRRIKDQAVDLNAQSDYIYMNYGSQFEDVIKSYGPENVARLKDIARKYDPQEVFQKLQPGYFKLDRAPIPNTGLFSG